MPPSKAWVGIDLDGTLAFYDKYRAGHIGEPIKPMVEYVKTLLENDVEVKIVTARASTSLIIEDEEAFEAEMILIRNWCFKHLGKRLEVTDSKDFNMVFLVDDRAVTVEMNTGEFIVSPPSISSIKWHDDKANPGNPEYDGSGRS